MDLTPIPVPAGVSARERCIVRGQRLVLVKFVALPLETRRSASRLRGPGRLRIRGELRPGPISSFLSFIIRVIDRLVAARP